MIDWKEVRESVGYTQAIQSKDWRKWQSLAASYRAAAEILEDFSDRIPTDTRPFAFNAALSIELILKSILAQRGVEIPVGTNGHDLNFLAKKSGIALNKDQILTLELLTETIVWSGRYPAPKTSERWDKYQDEILELHIVRSNVANASIVRANPNSFPNWANYLKIWDLCSALLEKHD